MDKIDLLVIIGIITMFISLLLALFLVSVKTEHKLGNRLFALFLVLTTIDLSGGLFNFFNEGPSNLGMFRNQITFLQLPTFYIYVLSVCYSDFKLRPKHLIHTIPFLLANLILFPRFYGVDLVSKASFLERSSTMIEIQFNHIFIHAQIVFYILLALTKLRKVKKVYLENYAGSSMESLNWLFQLTLAISTFYTLVFFRNVLKFSIHKDISQWLLIGLFLLELVIISWYLFKALNYPNLFRGIDSKLKLVNEILTEEKQHDPSSENEYHQNVLNLKKYMIEEKPFLNPSLTIQDVSNDLGIPTRELSLLINRKLGQHFFDFINMYRIENAMLILKDASKTKVTILEILYEVGFNSKSSFNTAFKKHTGITPTQYRNAL